MTEDSEKAKSSHSPQEEKGDKSSFKCKRKQNFSRKNIKQFNEANVNAETRAIQQAELDRQKRMNYDQGNNDFEIIITDQTEPKCASQNLFNKKFLPLPREGITADHAIIVEDFDYNSITDSAVIELYEHESEDDEPEIIETEICEIQDAQNVPDSSGKILINKNKKKDEPGIYLADHLVPIIKPHQVSGVRFMFENVVENLNSFNQNEGFGCILAHSMGLGKTIQVVTFIDILFRCCNAERVLIILPINTIQNWKLEFDRWLPRRKGKVCEETSSEDEQKEDKKPRKSDLQYNRNFEVYIICDTHKNFNSRYEVLHSWYVNKGVLLIGYEMFRLLAFPKNKNSFVIHENDPDSTEEEKPKKKKRRKKSIDQSDNEEDSQPIKKKINVYEEIYAALIDPGPQVVICDEGHRIKNSEATISKALKSMKTKRRVVLTGYPLQNNLLEYWCMVDFVRPKYLGTKQEFTSMFQRPIENGQCADSTEQDRKIMQGRAHVLHELLQGLVQRRSHMVLKASLPEKTEVVLLIKMSNIQRKLYSKFMEFINNSGSLGYGSNSILKTYAMCCKIWNHPDILRRAMEEHKEDDFDIEGFFANPTNSSKEPGKKKQSRKISVNIDSPKISESSCTNTDSQAFNNLEEESIQLDTSIIFPEVSGFLEQANQDDQDSPQTPILVNPIIPHSIANINDSLPHIQTSLSSDIACEVAKSICSTSRNKLPVNCLSNFKPKGPIIDAKMFFSQIATLQSTGTYDWAREIDTWCFKDSKGVDQVYSDGCLEYSGKMLILMELLDECLKAGDRMLVFSQSLFTLDLIESFLKNRKILEPTNKEDDNEESYWRKNLNYFRLDGSTPASERERQIRMFNDLKGSLRLFLISTRAGCLGINLIGANRVVVFDASWNPCHDCQAVCRVYRYGQKKKCYIYRLVTDNTMERKIYDRQVTKQSMSDRVVDESNPTQQFTRSQVEILCQYDDVEMPTLKESDLDTCKTISNGDHVLDNVIERNLNWITKIPFTHESLLIDRKECSLTKVEKQLARQNFEIEKRANSKYQAANQFHKNNFNSIHHIQNLQRQANLASFADLQEHTRPYKWSTIPEETSRSSPGILSRSRKRHDNGIVIDPEKFNPVIQAMREQEKQERVKMFQREIEAARKRYIEDNINRRANGGSSSSKRKQVLQNSHLSTSSNPQIYQHLGHNNNNEYFDYASQMVMNNQTAFYGNIPTYISSNQPQSTLDNNNLQGNTAYSYYPQLVDDHLQYNESMIPDDNKNSAHPTNDSVFPTSF